MTRRLGQLPMEDHMPPIKQLSKNNQSLGHLSLLPTALSPEDASSGKTSKSSQDYCHSLHGPTSLLGSQDQGPCFCCHLRAPYRWEAQVTQRELVRHANPDVPPLVIPSSSPQLLREPSRPVLLPRLD